MIFWIIFLGFIILTGFLVTKFFIKVFMWLGRPTLIPLTEPKKVKLSRKRRKQRKFLINSFLASMTKIGFEVVAKGRNLIARVKGQEESYLALEFIPENRKLLAHYNISFYREGKLVSSENIKTKDALKIQKTFQTKMEQTLPSNNPKALEAEINHLFEEANHKVRQEIIQENLEFLEHKRR